MGANLGISDDPVVVPRFTAGGDVEILRLEAHQQDCRLRFLLESVCLVIEPLGDDVEDGSDRNVGGPDGRARRVMGEPGEIGRASCRERVLWYV